MSDPGWIRGKVESEVVTTICMCYEPLPGFSLPQIHVIAPNFTGRSGREGKATRFLDGSAVPVVFSFFFINTLNLRKSRPLKLPTHQSNVKKNCGC